MKYKLSNQAIGSLMLALQKGLLEQIDITEILRGFEFIDTEDGLMVESPPMIHVSQDEQEEQSDA